MKHFVIILFLLPLIASGQNCTCDSTFSWMKQTFEENDAGFQYVINSKGESAYALHNQLFSAKRNEIRDKKDPLYCAQLLNEWLKFFRTGHIEMAYLGNRDNTEQSTVSSTEVNTEAFSEWETYPFDLEKFKSYLSSKTQHNYEGIWQSGSYRIGIKQENNEYVGFIIESEWASWKKGEVKLRIANHDNKMNSSYYMLDRSAVKSSEVALYGSNYLQLGNILLSRVFPKIKDASPYHLHFKALNASMPFMEQLNETTLYFRIPSFSGAPEKKAIDSVLAVNKEQILKTENLIIDIRNGTGGFDLAYYEILPYLYTNPIRTPGVEFLSTPLNNKRMLDFANNTGIAAEYNLNFSDEEKAEYLDYYNQLSKNIGEFVSVDTVSVHITEYDIIHTYPKNIGIIHNEVNASTDEQFLLAAKQSKKVKLFGKTTAGALDVSNLNFTKSPCGDYMLIYALSKSTRIPEMAIDEKGIQPDYYLDAKIPEHTWIEYVSRILNE